MHTFVELTVCADRLQTKTCIRIQQAVCLIYKLRNEAWGNNNIFYGAVVEVSSLFSEALEGVNLEANGEEQKGLPVGVGSVAAGGR